MLNLMRLRQWPKSLLVFLPFLLTLEDSGDFLKSAMVFLSFGMGSSAVYAFNDVVDKNADKLHPDKKHRPVASGLVLSRDAVTLSVMLAVTSLVIASIVNLLTLLVISVYLILNFAYSIYFKKLAVVDVIILSFFYILRIFAGAAAIMVEVSDWLLTFGFIVFLSLGLAKRFVEMETIRSEHGEGFNLGQTARAYRLQDSTWLFMTGISMGMISSLVLALYLDLGRSTANLVEYLIVPLWTYWILRIWLFASRGELHHDPTAFAMRDRATWFIGALIFALLIFGGQISDFVMTMEVLL